MPYGTVKVDNVTFTNNSVDATTTFSGIYASITNNLTLSGTATAATFTGTTANFTNVNAQNIGVTTSLSGLAITGGTAGFTTVTGTTVTGTTANFVTVSGTTTTGTTANFASGVFTTQVSGATVIAPTGTFTSLTGTTTTGTTANFVSGVFTTQVSGTTVIAPTGTFTSLTGTTATFTSGIIASGTAALPSLAILSDPNTGLFSPGADQLAISTNGTGRLFVDASGNVGLGLGTPSYPLEVASAANSTINITGGTSNLCRLFFSDTTLARGFINYDHADDSVVIGTAGSERLRITSTGALGLGTTSPVSVTGFGSLLTIADNAGGAIVLQDANTTAGYKNRFIASVDGEIHFGKCADDGTSPATHVLLDGAGRLGIGTTSPATTLAVNGNIGSNGRGTSFGYTLPDWRIYNSSSGNALVIDNYTTEALRVDSSSRLLVGTSSSSGANLLQVNSDALVNGLTVGRGLASISSNTAVGSGALSANTTGSYNTANGYQALYYNTTGNSNTANGYQALYSNTTGVDNTANGFQALYSNTTGSYNTATGRSALLYNTTGNSNTANGLQALLYNTTGNSNTANGLNALLYNTTGNDNTANGFQALYSNTTGSYNTANGRSALYSNTTGSYNTANGLNALYYNTTGNSNTANGFQAGYGVGTNSNTTGSNNTFIGNESVGASSTASNVITLGNGSIATLRCQVTTITALSDERDKKNIAPLNAGLDFLTKLRPVSFTWNTRDKAKVDVEDTGFIAQELLAVQEDTGITIPNLVSQENPDKLEAGYGTLIPVLVSAVQELTAMVKQLQDEITTLKGDN